jgi:hypothetical protein
MCRSSVCFFSETAEQISIIFRIGILLRTFSDESDFGPYLFNVTRILHDAQIEVSLFFKPLILQTFVVQHRM